MSIGMEYKSKLNCLLELVLDDLRQPLEVNLLPLGVTQLQAQVALGCLGNLDLQSHLVFLFQILILQSHIHLN